MLDRASCERRVYRLATLLTGNPLAATKVIDRVLDAQPDLNQLDGAHMDRLTVLRSREIPASALVDPGVPPPFAEALAAISAQQREAWVFGRVYQTSEREMARAMDCSTTAAARHLEQADLTMAGRLGDRAPDAARVFLQYSLALQIPRFYHHDRQASRRRRKWTIAAIVGLAGLGLIALAIRFLPLLFNR